ncbi:MAG: serine/threonine protein phosphatase [Anaerolineae bacterium]|nr:serine/threonine protein phosphatase [Anaerolineae bacterium]
MSVSTRLTAVSQTVPEITFDNQAKFIFFSDCHRGDNSWADDFAHNQALFFHALQHYNREKFTYIEVGDGDELWENSDFSRLKHAHSHVYWLLSQFYRDDRFHLLYGNHNIVWKNPQAVKEHLYHYFDEVEQTEKPLFEGITPQEGLILQHQESDQRILVTHGHQGDLFSETLWPLSCFLVRVLWKPLQILGLRDPTSPAQNYQKRNRVERDIMAWIEEHQCPVICGHTHRPVFPNPDEPAYYNTGSVIHPRCITGMEIENGEITLIKWWVRPDAEGLLQITREVLEGPRPVAEM